MKLQLSGGVEIDESDLPRKQLKAGEAVYGLVEIRVTREPSKQATASDGTRVLSNGSIKTLIPLSGEEAANAEAQFAKMRADAEQIPGQVDIDGNEAGA